MSNKAEQLTMRCLCIQEPSIVIHQVCAAPLRVLPVWLVNAPLDGDARRAGQNGGLVWGDLVFRIEGDEVGGMPVVEFGLVEVFKPLLQLAMFADLQRW